MHPLRMWLYSRSIAEHRAFTQSELAKLVGSSSAEISRVINGKRPSLSLAYRIRQVTGISLDVQYPAVLCPDDKHDTPAR